MKFTAAAVLAAAVSGAAAWNNVTVTTEVVDKYTTYCPASTQITHGNKTYTVTEPTTLTITDCPCTVTRPVTTSRYVSCETDCAQWNATTVQTSAPQTEAPTTTGPSALPTAGAGKAAALSGAGLAGIVGLAAFAL